jgi:hypothetical protein
MSSLMKAALTPSVRRAYMELARLLQPAMVVIEDVDLIARDRGEMAGHARRRCSTSCSTKWMD